MSSKNKDSIQIRQSRATGTIPQFILLAHRHLEKEIPLGEPMGTDGRKYVSPTDLLGVAGIPPEIQADIASIEMVYKK